MAEPFYYGTAYYPELWTEREISQDIQEMKALGINCVRIGEFAWHKMEPEPGKINLSFFRNMIHLLKCNGIDTVLCTPTPTPPRWLTFRHPETAFVNQDGVAYEHGARQHVCTNHPFFQLHAFQIVEAMARELGSLPGVTAWQLDNELKCHVKECCCPTCKGLWHQWLRNKYGTIEALNEAWGTEVWSEAYSCFEEVPQPVATPFLHNPSLTTNYRIFSMEKINDFAHRQARIIRKYSTAPITHNTGITFALDNEALFHSLDFVSFDAYPQYTNFLNFQMQFDRWRALKGGKRFWVMETSPSHAGHTYGTPPPHPQGYLRCEAVAAAACGARGFSYWLWRQQRTGCEIPHGSILYSWGEHGLGYDNVKEVGEILRKLEPILSVTEVEQPQTALLFSDHANAFFQSEPMADIRYPEQIRRFYDTLVDMGLHRDVISEGAELERYRMVLVPFLPAVEEELLQRLYRFVEQGGVAVIGPMTGYRTMEHTVHTDHALGKLEALCGIRVTQFYRADGTDGRMEGFGRACRPVYWAAPCEPAAGTDTESLASYRTTLHTAASAATRHQVGRGYVYTLAAMPEGEDGISFLKGFLQDAVRQAEVTQQYPTTISTLSVPRVNDRGERFLFLVNIDGKGDTLRMGGEWTDLFTVETAAEIVLEGYGYRILR